MALHVIQDTLATTDCTIIAHQTNCFTVAQTPIAKELQIRFPEAYRADKRYQLPPRERLGRFSFALTEDGSKLIFNLYGQFRYGEQGCYTDYEAFRSAFDAMLQAVMIAKGKGFSIKIGIPNDIGQGVAGGERHVILSILETLSTHYQVDIYLMKNVLL